MMMRLMLGLQLKRSNLPSSHLAEDSDTPHSPDWVPREGNLDPDIMRATGALELGLLILLEHSEHYIADSNFQ